MTQLETCWIQVHQRIESACRLAGRDPDSVQLIAVSKTRTAREILALHALGQARFGENYVQEFVAKWEALTPRAVVPPLEWHFIGALQRNKTRAVAERADWVHSIDRLKIAQRLSDQRPADRPALQVCLQVDLSGEPGKAGIAEADLEPLAAATAELPGLRLRGLMALPPPSTDPTEQRRPFRRLRELLDRLNARGHRLDTLSMGMSGDLEAAILEGATLVRVGTALFGPRNAQVTQA
ncbi:alanine racemase domain protein [Thioalkalivibrio nitratireducens DSM 14787]|uniref:Pyridoxal phosphate homeostasis protein n=1 Tax=Thioalkalivibrio nitratireducens (strain DSM 14787 / UNIQEM 213 / ALEN2) TaxID=1255043 RepID=L0DR01_THIND|nr:YggS family pyridoxal phosphate-dependent enzyme [Thioalkalivibrio nitratireducens]AGA32009.1 alanine racemase domain protein [Thioalkalivibrio nitratireducens DSM 14787]